MNVLNERTEISGKKKICEKRQKEVESQLSHKHTQCICAYVATKLQLTSVQLEYWLFVANKQALHKQSSDQICVNKVRLKLVSTHLVM